MQYIYDHKISSDLNIINSAIKNILLDTRRMLDEDLFFDFRLVLNELLINCYEHGNKCDCDKKILLKLKIDNKEIKILVQDEGSGVACRRKYNAEEKRPDGRGLIIVESLVDDINYDNNKIRCKIKLTPNN